MPYIETSDHTRIHYEDWGDGSPIVFLAAWGMSSRMWQYQMATVADLGFRTVTYDRRGHGRSDRPGSGYDYDSLADDLAEIINHLDLRDITLVTHSMGEGEAVRYLTNHGDERVAKLIMASPPGPLPSRTDDNPNGFDPALIEAVRETWRQDFPAWMDANQDGFLGTDLPDCTVSSGVIDWTRRDLMDTSLWALIECNKTGSQTDRRPDMAAVQIPTLIIHGDHDQSIPLELSGSVCHSLIAGSVLKVYENAPHALYLTHRDQLTADILEFAKN